MVKANSVSWRSRVLRLGYALLLGSFVSVLPTKVGGEELSEIQARGSLIIAVKDNLPPLGFEDAQGDLKGFEIDLARRLAQEILGSPDAVEFQPVMNAQRLKVILTGEVDLTIAQVGQTASRSRLVTFSRAYYLDRIGFISKDKRFQTLDDLSQSKILVLDRSSAIAQVRFHLPQAQLIGVASYQEALSVLEADEAIAFAGDRTVLAGWIQQHPQYHLAQDYIGGKALAVVMPKGLQYSSLHQRVNQTIRQLKESGWLDQKAREWGLAINN
jgi:polar amino acid transport system substrate-binding protein